MQKVAKIATMIVLWLFVSFGVWFALLSIYEIIAEPEAFTKFELFMSILVSCHISEKICDFVFKVQDKCVDKTESVNDIIPLDKVIKMYEKEFDSDSFLVRQTLAYLKELNRYREGVIQNDN